MGTENRHNKYHKDTDAISNEKGQKIGWIVIAVTHDEQLNHCTMTFFALKTWGLFKSLSHGLYCIDMPAWVRMRYAIIRSGHTKTSRPYKVYKLATFLLRSLVRRGVLRSDVVVWG